MRGRANERDWTVCCGTHQEPITSENKQTKTPTPLHLKTLANTQPKCELKSGVRKIPILYSCPKIKTYFSLPQRCFLPQHVVTDVWINGQCEKNERLCCAQLKENHLYLPSPQPQGSFQKGEQKIVKAYTGRKYL